MRLAKIACTLLPALAATVFLFTLSGCGGSQPQTNEAAVTGTSSGTVPAGQATQLYTLINQERNRRGFSSLSVNTSLEFVALQYSTELAAANVNRYNFAINDLDGATRVRNVGIGFSELGHQGAIDFTQASSLLTSLLAANSFVIAEPSYRLIGIGVARGTSHNYWTIFVTR
jgi:uncharacterized protein YkwD